MMHSNIIMKIDRYGDREIMGIYREMAKDTSLSCGICGKRNITGSELIVEHSHETGYIRGLVCRACNYQLGWLEKLQGIAPEFKPFYNYLEKARQEEIEISTFLNDVQEVM